MSSNPPEPSEKGWMFQALGSLCWVVVGAINVALALRPGGGTGHWAMAAIAGVGALSLGGAAWSGRRKARDPGVGERERELC
ncbi:hypothetical protein ACG5V6_21200 [Streptomyces chitinivorans]|uniref:DUF2530 domain-containing protein n=1 Tax=Streptomyces chitinivorans TaxID=1257027 RepID=A0ABW7HXS6_9ACTN|nr:hypothetical protein [Streptomyces chitinivorans]MDH2409765.1 hypothetical protein [Streptomyces chitinivorans]